MIYSLLILSVVLCLVIFNLISSYNSSKKDFQKKVKLLEEIIIALKTNLENQNQKIKLSDDLELRLKMSNQTMNNSIFNLNYEIFEELYSKK